MKIKVSNLGTIKQTELDLRPLTVIIGPNNSSKTYLAYSVCGLFDAIIDSRPESREHAETGDRLTVDLERSTVTTSLADLATSVNEHLRAVGREFAHGLGFFFQDTSGRLFQDSTVDLEVSVETIARAIRDDGEVTRHAYKRSHSIRRILRSGDQILIEHDLLVRRSKGSLETAARLLGEGVLRDVVVALLWGSTPAPFLLPAERNALIITYKLLSARRLKLLRDAARGRVGAADEAMRRQMDLLREQGEIRYPQPIEDFLDFLTDVEISAGRQGQTSPFLALATLVEQSLSSGGRLESTPTPLGGSELRLSLPEGPSIDLYNASSSIKQLTALLLYLRHRAAPNQLLIIDEPEMNLHPLAQAKLLEALAILVKLGVHVLLTTHSPYFMAHLANLSQAAPTERARKKQAEHLYLRDPRALLTPEEVGAYEMRDNTLVSLADPDFGLRWDTLSDVFSDLQERFFKLEGLAHGQARKKK